MSSDHRYAQLISLKSQIDDLTQELIELRLSLLNDKRAEMITIESAIRDLKQSQKQLGLSIKRKEKAGNISFLGQSELTDDLKQLHSTDAQLQHLITRQDVLKAQIRQLQEESRKTRARDQAITNFERHYQREEKYRSERKALARKTRVKAKKMVEREQQKTSRALKKLKKIT